MQKNLLVLVMILVITLSIFPLAISTKPETLTNGFSPLSTTETREVSQPLQLTTDPHYDRNPSVFKAYGTYWLFFVRAASATPHIPPAYNPDTDSYDVYYMTSTDGVSWSTETKLTACSTGQRGMAAFHDDTGAIWVVTSAPGNNSILYFKSTDNGTTWTGPVNTGYTGSHVDAFQASDGKIWIFYEGNGIEAIKSSDYGSSWTHVTGIGPSPNDGIPKAMEADGKLYVVWCNWNVGGKAWYTTSTDGLTGDAWAAPQLLVDVPGTIMCDPVMVKNASEYVLFYAPWETATDAQWIEVITSTDLSTWSNRSRVTNGGYGTTYWWDMWPDVLVDGSDLYLFYGSEKNGTQRGDGNIFMYKVDWNLARNHYDAIQPAIDAAAPDDTIVVHEGTYTEQLIINKSLTLEGMTGAKIVAPDTRSTFTIAESTATWDPIIFAYGSLTGSETISVTIEGFEIDGGNKAASGYRYVAGLLRNVKSGIVFNNTIHSMYPPSGTGKGPQTFGILVYGDSEVTISHNEIRDFSRGGIGITGDAGPGADPSAIIEQNTVLGNGLENESGWWAENGIQVGYGATASIQDNEVYDCTVNSTNWAATGILIVDTEEGAVVDGNHIEGCDVGISAVDFPSAYGPPWDYSILLNVLITNNTLIANTWQIDISNDAKNVTVTYNDIINATGNGIDVWSYFGDVFPVDVEIHYNNIEGSGSYGLWTDENLTETVDARYNWWGHSSGPSGAGPGTGDAISGNILFDPWLSHPSYTPPVETRISINPLLVEKHAFAGIEGTEFSVDVEIQNVLDLWGFDFELTWNSSLLSLVGVEYEAQLNALWGENNWFVVNNQSSVGWYKFTALALSPATGFSGSAPLVKLTFRVEYGPCYIEPDYQLQTRLHFALVKLSDSEAEPICAQVKDGTYIIYAVRPWLKMKYVRNLSGNITCRKLSETFTLQIKIIDAFKVSGFEIEIHYNTTLMDPINIEWGNLTGFLPGPYIIKKYTVDEVNGLIRFSLSENVTAGAPLAYGDRVLAEVTFNVTKAKIWKKCTGVENYFYDMIEFTDWNITVRCPTVHFLTGELVHISNAEYWYIPIQGDINSDGDVDIFDLRTVAYYYEVEQGDPEWADASKYDLNCDNIIDLYDLVLIATRYGYEYDC